MNTLKTLAIITVALALSACGGPDKAKMDKQLTQAAQIGQAQAIAQIIERAMADPCQPINLFNNVDENNKKEVNLINVACESLNLPEITEAAAEAETPETTE